MYQFASLKNDLHRKHLMDINIFQGRCATITLCVIHKMVIPCWERSKSSTVADETLCIIDAFQAE